MSFSTRYVKNIFFLNFVFIFLLAQAQLDTTCNLASEEQVFMHKREAITQAKLLAHTKDLFSHNPNGFDAKRHKLPRIAFCLSGGGNRALITSLGFMHGAQTIGLLDCTSYVSCLSGSSWFYISFLLKNISHNMSLQDYKTFLQPRLEKKFKRDPQVFYTEIQNIKKTKRQATISDGWGRIVYNYLVGDTVHEQASFKDIRDHLVSSGQNMPFPLFTAIIKNRSPYQWLEVNPFMLGADQIGYIPTSSFGSTFARGSCTKILPELSLSSFMGIFGSAYCLNSTEFTTALKTKFLPKLLSQEPSKLTQQEPQKLPTQEQLAHAKKPTQFEKYWGVGIQLLPNPVESYSQFNNFLLETDNNPVSDSHIVVADAGIDFNIPTPPLFKKQRAIDIIIVCDASYKNTASQNNFMNLKKAKKHAQRHGIAFPQLSNPIKLTDTVFAFEDQDPTIPTVIYFRSSATASTLKFSYTADEFTNICNEAHNALVTAHDGIFEAIVRKTRLLNGFAAS